ncbi:MAG: Spy/CpxP family protein refolding chaperone [Magnetococcales bacterium]|nr:Spy/CpxP family protein refolding chaperone [Magnetococcales bacterium]
MPHLFHKPRHRTNLLLGALLTLSVNLLIPNAAHSQGMDFGNMQMPSPNNWLPPNPANWNNNGYSPRNGPPPQWQQNNGPSNQQPPQWQNPGQNRPSSNRPNRGPNRYGQKGMLTAKQLETLKFSLHLTTEQEPAWAAYAQSFTPQQQPQPGPNDQQAAAPLQRDPVTRMERQIQQMEKRVAQRKMQLNAHKNLLASLDEKQKVIFNLLSQQYQQQRRSGQNSQGRGSSGSPNHRTP